MKGIALILMFVLAISCRDSVAPKPDVVFENAVPVTVYGYTIDLMEPFLSRDGSTLLFNNSNAATNTSLQWATRVNDTLFQYEGTISGVDTDNLEGVPTMDASGTLFFVSTRDYDVTLSTIFKGHFNKGSVTQVEHVLNLASLQPGMVNFDVEVNATGETIYFADGLYTPSGGPLEADLVMATKVNGEFQRVSNSDELLDQVNTDDLEYAAAISNDNLELYFTRAKVNAIPSIWVSTRSSDQDAFGAPKQLIQLTGFVEAPTLSPNGKLLYYHKRGDDGKYQLWVATRHE